MELSGSPARPFIAVSGVAKGRGSVAISWGDDLAADVERDAQTIEKGRARLSEDERRKLEDRERHDALEADLAAQLSAGEKHDAAIEKSVTSEREDAARVWGSGSLDLAEEVDEGRLIRALRKALHT